ncbi:hypothetical protein Tco_1114009 [Tanacetum coccineum]|uniref:Uncharacterized protein n=1 Tax=Tanacetum coccineum TaxID=301880 RepID=A0ABQ5ITT3_9ASTR
MAPKRATRSTPVTTTTDPTATTTTTVINAQLQAMINQGVSAALAARDATRNGTRTHSRERVSGILNALQECTVPGFHEVLICLLEEMQKLEAEFVELRLNRPCKRHIEMATEMIGQESHTIAERQAKTRGISKNTSRSNQNQQLTAKQRQNTDRHTQLDLVIRNNKVDQAPMTQKQLPP